MLTGWCEFSQSFLTRWSNFYVLTGILLTSLLSWTGEFNCWEDTLFITGVGDSSLSPLVLKLDTEDPADLGVSASGLERFVSIFGFSDSSLRKLDLRRRVLSATEGGFSGRGGAGPLLPTVTGVLLVLPLEFVLAIFWKHKKFNTKSDSLSFRITHLALKLPK